MRFLCWRVLNKLVQLYGKLKLDEMLQKNNPFLSLTLLFSTALWTWREDMVNQRRRAGNRQEGIHRVPQAFGRRAWREALLRGWKNWVCGCGPGDLLLLVLCIRDLWQLQHRGGVPQVDRLDQEVHGKGERVVFSGRPTQGPWLCYGDEKEAWHRIKRKHHGLLTI